MEGFLQQLVRLSVFVYAAASMLSVGLGHTVADVVGPLRHPGRVARVLLTNFLLVPLLGFLLFRLFSLDRPYAIGLFLVACAAGAPFLIKLTMAARGDVAFAGALLLLLLPATVLFLALVVPLVLPGADVDPAVIARPLVLTMLLPLAVGLAVRPLLPRLAAKAVPLLSKAATVALVTLLAGTLIANLAAFASLLGEGAIAAAILFEAGAFALGYTVGGRKAETRSAIALASAQRNIAAATVVAAGSLGGGKVLLMVVLVAVVGILLLFPAAFAIRERAENSRAVRTLRRRQA